MADERLEVIASLIIVIVAATAFLMLGMVEGTVAFQFGMEHRRELLSYLLIGLLTVASGLYLALSSNASLQTIALVAAPHAFLFGAAELRLARQMRNHPSQRNSLVIFGSCEVALGVALVSTWKSSNQRAATVLVYAAVLSLLQLLPFLLYKRRVPSLNPRRPGRSSNLAGGN